MTKCDAQMVKYILQLGLSLLRKTLLSLAGVFILINLTAVLNLNQMFVVVSVLLAKGGNS